MSGILDGTYGGVLGMNPRDSGLLAAAFRGLQASGPSRMPVSMGQVIGQAGEAGMGAYRQAEQLQMQKAQQEKQMQMFQMQLAQFQQAQAEKQKKDAALAQLAKDPRMAGMAQLLNVSPQAAIDRAFPKANKPVVVSPGASLVDPSKPEKPIYTAPAKPEKPSSLAQLIAERDALPANHPQRMVYDAAISKATSHAPAAATTTINKINAYAPASEEAQRDFMKSTRVNYDALRSAPVALRNIDEAKKLIPGAKGFMGPGGESLLEAAKFMNNRLGMKISTEGVKDAEELRTRIFFNIMDNLKKMDAQPSQMQQQIMMESLGKLGTDPNALASVLDAFADSIKGKVELHNREVEGAEGKGVKFPYNPRVEIGGLSDSNPKKVMKGQVVKGYRFKGGDPAVQSNWEKVQ